ncbi:hypothetical protein BGZ61DRAFT_438999 [Ilyonectria robusta]|uniref:uncharacterized protein n=1 Tax=Ilyonectria robusta TaxID=1079257 RepID=UPI001E8DD52C|nr:uncharacterized protein BGZ61DRAFT_438999 [Ilyonectria robusta]KAH8737788.1 hypothetical protein BGZ61DRAFT_438999 [Ilyonectria robusta]
MSSMFKKKGGLAFKPKIPSGRARPAAPVPPPQPAKPPQSQPSIDAQSQPAHQETPETPDSATPTVDSSAVTTQVTHEPPHHASPTPPESVPENAKHDDTTTLDQVTSDKPHEPEAVPTVARVENETAVGEPETQLEATALKSAPTTEPERVQPAPAKDISIPDDSHGEQQPDTTVVPTPAPHTVDEVATTESSATPSITPAESSETTSQAPEEAREKPAPKPRSRKQSAKTAQEETVDGDDSARPKKRPRKTAKDGAGAAPKQPRKRKTPTQTDGEGQARSRRARSITPEDSENQIVDLQQLKMADLTKDLHIGKKFSRHDELRERERRTRLKAKVGLDADGERDGSETPDRTEPGPKKDSPATTSAPAPASGPQFRIVDGQIVVDQSSLAVDRHARAAAVLGDMETVEENDFTRLITSNSFMNTSKLKGPNIWTDPETELFYRGLRMFGTDFEMISKMFPRKQRRHIKLKFNREERHRPRRIDAAIIGEKTIKMDLDEYKAFTGSEFESVESIEAEQRKIQEDFEAEQQRVADEQAEIMRKKREELFADDDDDAAKKKKGKKGKQKVIYGLNGEPIAAES